MPTNYEEKAEQARILAEYYESINDKLSEQEARQQRIIQYTNEEKDALQKVIDLKNQGKDTDAAVEEARAKAARAARQAIEEQKKASAELEKALKSSRRAAEDLGRSMASVFAGEDAIKFENIISDIGSGLGKLAKSFEDGRPHFMSFLNGLSSAALVNFATQLFKTSVQLADLEDNFRRATGASAGMARSVTNVYEETRKLGFSMQEASKASESLYNNFTDFTMVSKSTRESLAETSVVLSRMGISHDTFSKSVQLSTKALGMSAAQAGQTMLDLEGFSESLGVAPSKMAEDFIGARNAVAKLGQDGTQAFKDLAIAAKVTGMSIDSILRLTDAFDTFDGAAAQAGKLNAAIGGNFVNAMDLMMATDPAERFNMIRDSLLDTGLSFDEMSYYQKNFFKESLGLSDVGELAALMSGEMDLVAGATDQSSQSLIEAKKKAAELATAQESLNAVLVQITPVIVDLVDGIQSLTTYMAENSEEIAEMIRLVLGLIVAIKAITVVFGALKFVLTAIVPLLNIQLPASLMRLRAALIPASRDVKIFGQVAQISGKQMLALGLAVIAMGAGMAIAAIGMGYFVASFKDLGVNAIGAVVGILAFTAAFGVLMLLLISLVAGPQAAATAAAVGVIYAVGFAILMMGGAIAAASIGLSYLVTSLGQLGSLSASLLLIPVILYGVAGALSMMVNPITLTGIVTMTALFTAMGFAAKNMGIETAESFKTIADAINSVPTTRNIAFTRSMNSASRAFSSARTAAPAVRTAPSSYQVTINVMLDRERLATVVREITAQDALNQAAGRGTA